MGAERNRAVVAAGVATVVVSPEVVLDARDDAVTLMERAVRLALADAGAHGPPISRSSIGWIGVPEGTWFEPDPAGVLAGRLGAAGATTVRADVGVTQDELLAAACSAVASGDCEVAVVVGGEDRFRQRQRRAATLAPEPPHAPHGSPTVHLRPSDLGVVDLEIVRDCVTPAVGFALTECALRAAADESPEAHFQWLAGIQAQLDQVAAAQHDHWRPAPLDADEIAADRTISTPYTRPMCSDWTVDMAAAVVITSADGHPGAVVIARTAWSNHSISVAQRPRLEISPGARAVADAVLQGDAPDVTELYSCFPAALQLWADAVHHATTHEWSDPARWTLTGGMAAAGGPLNNAALHGWVAMVRRLRHDQALRVGLSTSVSGTFVKQGATLWTQAGTNQPFAAIDLTEPVAAAAPALPLVADLSGEVTVVAHTVDARGPRLVAVVERDGQRTIAESRWADTVNRWEDADMVGTTTTIDADGHIVDPWA